MRPSSEPCTLHPAGGRGGHPHPAFPDRGSPLRRCGHRGLAAVAGGLCLSATSPGLSSRNPGVQGPPSAKALASRALAPGDRVGPPWTPRLLCPPPGAGWCGWSRGSSGALSTPRRCRWLQAVPWPGLGLWSGAAACPQLLTHWAPLPPGANWGPQRGHHPGLFSSLGPGDLPESRPQRPALPGWDYFGAGRSPGVAHRDPHLPPGVTLRPLAGGGPEDPARGWPQGPRTSPRSLTQGSARVWSPGPRARLSGHPRPGRGHRRGSALRWPGEGPSPGRPRQWPWDPSTSSLESARVPEL